MVLPPGSSHKRGGELGTDLRRWCSGHRSSSAPDVDSGPSIDRRRREGARLVVRAMELRWGMADSQYLKVGTRKFLLLKTGMEDKNFRMAVKIALVTKTTPILIMDEPLGYCTVGQGFPEIFGQGFPEIFHDEPRCITGTVGIPTLLVASYSRVYYIIQKSEPPVS
eukprot:COSAG02_NODE_17542_length_996_cov_2.023411_1_plen_166_part_00